MAVFRRKYATATHVYLPMIKRGVVDFAVGADWTPQTGDVKVSIDGGAAADIGTLPAAIAMGNGAIWDFTVATGEATGKKIVITVADSATKAVEDQCFEIETYGHASAEIPIDLSDSVRMGMTALPNAAAAASGGLHILGTNAFAVSYTAGYTISNASGDAFTITSSGGNGNAMVLAGNGSGHGMKRTGGATGHGCLSIGGTTSGHGVSFVGGTLGDGANFNGGTHGHGLTTTGTGASKHGLNAVGGTTTAHGVNVVGGTTSGDAFVVTAINGRGALWQGGGTSSEGFGVYGADSGVGMVLVGGGSSGAALYLDSNNADTLYMNCTGGHGVNIFCNSPGGNGIDITTGNFLSGGGHGIHIAPQGTNVHGIKIEGGGTQVGVCDGINVAAGTGGVAIRSNIVGNITGNLVGTVTTVTTVGTVSGNVAGNVSGNLTGNVLGTLSTTERAAIAAAIWDLLTSGHTTVGTFGAAMNNAGSAGDPLASPIPGSYTGSQAGAVIAGLLPLASYTAPNNAGITSIIASIAAGLALTVAERQTIADVLIGRNIKGSSSTGRTVGQALAAIRNKVAFDVPSAGLFTVFDTDDVTPLWTGAYTASSGADPVTMIDPT
jgi:hypothetical protein